MASDSRVIFSTELDESGLKRGLSKLGSSVGTMAKGMGLAIGAVAAGLGVLAKNALQYNSSMEQYQTSFATMLGSTEAAEKKVAELKEFAAKTPFEMTDLADATKTLLGFGVAEGKASVAMRQLGDISQGNSAKFGQLSLVYGQMSSTGKLMGQDLLQMINAGFNPLNQIAAKTGASMGDLKAVMSGDKTSKEFNKMVKDAQKEVKKLGESASPAAKMLAQIGTEGMISADMVDQAMQIATSEGGLYFGAMEKQSQTFSGRLSTLKDNFNSLSGEVFGGFSTAMAETVLPMASGYVDTLSEAFKANGAKGIVSAFGAILGDVVSKGATYAPQLVGMAVSLIKSLVSGLKKNAPTIAKGFVDTLKVAAVGMAQGIPDMVSVLLDIAMELISSLADALPDMIPEIVESLVDAIVRLVDNAPKLIYAGKDIILAILTGIARSVPTLLAGVGKVFASLLLGIHDNTQAVNDYVAEKTAGMKEKYDGVVTSLNALKTTLNESLVTGAATEEGALTLLDQLEAYSKLEYPTAEDTANAQAMTTSLVGLYSGLSEYVGEDGLFSAELTTIRSLIAEYANEAEALAYRDYLVGLYKSKIEETNQLKQQTATYKDEQGNLKQLQEQVATLNNLKASMESLNDTPKDWSSEDTITKVKALAQAYKDAGGDLSSLNINLDDFGDNSYDEFIALYDSLTSSTIPALDLGIEAQQTLLDTIMNGDSGIVALQALLGTTQSEITTVGQTIAGLYTDDKTTEVEEKTKSLKKNVDTDITNTGTVLDDGKTTLKDKAIAVRDAIMEGMATEGETTAESVGTNIADGVGVGVDKSTKIKTKLTDKVTAATDAAKLSAKMKGYPIGTNIADGIAIGIDAHAWKINAALTSAIKAAILAIMFLLDMHSPSIVMRDKIGKNMVLGLSDGINKNASGITDALTSSIAASVKAGKAMLDNTLLAQVGGADSFAYPTQSQISSTMLRGTAYAGSSAGSVAAAGSTSTIDARQYITFAQPMQAPDEIARAIRRQDTHGLAGARV